MYRQDVSGLKAGMVLAKTLYSERGETLLAAGTELTAPYIDSLRRRGFLAVFVHDNLGDDVEPKDIVSEQVRATTAAHVARVFELVMATSSRGLTGPNDRPGTVDEVIRRLGPRELELPPEGISALQTLYRDIESIMEEILSSDTVASLESLKTHSTYTFEHSVDVAIVGILLGRKAGLARKQLRELALGCLLHDIGKTYIDVSIVDKPDRLTVAEFEEVKKHPLMGFELVRRMPVFSILPAHVAYQHHERQDGSGYPRGLEGSNRMVRTTAERLDPRRMLLIAEIAAVADVYSALSSDRPYRPALSTDRIVSMLESLAGRHLNREILNLLLRTVPAYPVGHWVEVTAGAYRGWRGVVVRVQAEALDRPTIRLLLDQRGEVAQAPVELDLRARPDVALACIPPGSAPFRES